MKAGIRQWIEDVRLLPTWLVCVAGIMFNFATVGPGASKYYQANSDFRHFYVGARLVRTGGLYNGDSYLAMQRELFGVAVPSLVTSRLPFYYALISPLGWFQYKTALWIWLAIMVLATAGFVMSFSGGARLCVAVACCWSWPLLFSLGIGQDIALVLMAIGAACRAIYHQRKWGIAGLLLSFGLIKFNVILLVPLLILGQRKWRFGAGFLAGTAFLLAASCMAAGWGWLPRYLSIILDPRGSPGLEDMPNLRGLASTLGLPAVIEILISIAVAGIVWWVARRRPFSIAAAATLLGSILLSQHAYFQDCAILIPALLALIRPANGAPVRYCAWILLSPMPYIIGFFRESGSVVTVLMLVLLTLIVLDRSNRGIKPQPSKP